MNVRYRFVDKDGNVQIIRVPPLTDIPCTTQSAHIDLNGDLVISLLVDQKWIDDTREAMRKRGEI